MKQANKNKLKVIWAVDPFAKDRDFQRAAAWALHSLGKAVELEIVPVYSMPERLPGPAFEAGDGLVEHVRNEALDEIDEILQRVKLPGLQPLKVISNGGFTLKGSVDSLVAYAKECGAKLIVASTKARKGPLRWMTGSFAETLMLRSDVPLLVVSPYWERTMNLKHIIFPTDFSDESKEVFGKVLDLAQEMGSKVTLHHKVSYELEPGLQLALSSYPPYQVLYEDEVKRARDQAARWKAQAEAKGIKIETFVDTRFVGSAAESVLRCAKKNSGMIAMAARSGPIAAALVGSTTRQVVRASVLPVLIFHPTPKAGARASAAEFSVTESEVMDDLQRHGRGRTRT